LKCCAIELQNGVERTVVMVFNWLGANEGDAVGAGVAIATSAATASTLFV
jgi:hypothetical protein